MSAGWRIASWSRVDGRGVIVSPSLGQLPFDGAAAMVADFRLGEAVEVSLERAGATFRVTRVWPDDPRFVPAGPVPPSAPSLDPATEARVAGALASASALDFRVASLNDGTLVVQGDDTQFDYGHRVEIRFEGVGYLELPTWWDGKTFGVATDVERRDLAGRTEVDATTIAVRIVDDTRRIYFVTCADVRVSLSR